LHETIKFSTAVRRTIAKTLTYFSFIVMVILIDFATSNEYHIAKFFILFICVVEGGSIISNILKPHGYDIDFKKLVGLFLKKFLNIDKEDSEGILSTNERREGESLSTNYTNNTNEGTENGESL
jgi:hypothetical protein